MVKQLVAKHEKELSERVMPVVKSPTATGKNEQSDKWMEM